MQKAFENIHDSPSCLLIRHRKNLKNLFIENYITLVSFGHTVHDFGVARQNSQFEEHDEERLLYQLGFEEYFEEENFFPLFCYLELKHEFFLIHFQRTSLFD